MARTISDEELQLKQRARRRLIGAVVLVTAIVVVLPMVLDSEPRQNAGETVSVQIPSPDSGGFTSKVVPLNPAPAPKAEPKPEAKAEPVPPASPAQAPAEEAKKAPAPPPAPAPVVQEAPKEAPKPAEKAAAVESAKPVKAAPAREAAKPPVKSAKAAPKSKDGQYVVQVIALADAGRAKQMQEKIAAAGVRSYTEVVKTSKGEVTRVRAGPFTTRAAAEKARAQLKALGMSGNVTTR